MNYALYNLLTNIAVLPTAVWIAAHPKHRPLLKRFAPEAPGTPVAPFWVHACSVGELNTARPVIADLRNRWGDVPVVLSVSTTAAYKLATRNPTGATLTWFPIDQRQVVARFIDRLNPRALLLMETEIWPNVIREAKRRGIPSLVLNARISDKHFARYRRHGDFFRSVFTRITAVAAQHQTYADRFASLGVDAERIDITGNIKFDNLARTVDPGKLEALRAECGLEGREPVIVFGSTRPGDESLAASCWKAWREKFPNAHLIVAPRHRERIPDALAAFDEPALLRSAVLEGKRPTTDRILIVDTLGELVDFYALATVAVVGGSFYSGVNGHNPLEPAALGVPTVFGPYMSNFIDPAEVLIAARAAVQVTEPRELEHAVTALLNNAQRREALSTAAIEAVERNRGALARTIEIVERVVSRSELPA